MDEEEDDPIPNELDNALVHLIPAITACGGDPSLPSYLDLDTFEKLAGPALKGGDGVLAGGGGGGGNGDSSGSARRHLDARISAEIEVAFRHCMHEASLALVGADADIGGGGGRRGGGRARKGKKEAAASQTEAEAMVKTMSGPLGILSLALEFVSREDELNESGGGISVALGGLPMQLLEDFLESQVKAWEGERRGPRSQGTFVVVVVFFLLFCVGGRTAPGSDQRCRVSGEIIFDRGCVLCAVWCVTRCWSVCSLGSLYADVLFCVQLASRS